MNNFFPKATVSAVGGLSEGIRMRGNPNAVTSTNGLPIGLFGGAVQALESMITGSK